MPLIIGGVAAILGYQLVREWAADATDVSAWSPNLLLIAAAGVGGYYACKKGVFK